MFQALATLALLAGMQAQSFRHLGPIDFGPYIIFFDSGSARITSAAAPILDNAAAALAQAERENPDFVRAVYLIRGHSDRVGRVSDNQRLSCARAQAARAYLIARGIAAERLVPIGYGELLSHVETEDEVAEPENRYVEISIMGPDQAAHYSTDTTRC